ncbi:YfhO family protein [Flavitalea sp.]|nr:YfhO family protein [Flavitalea sp.]
MNKTLWQQFRPHAIAIGIFLIISVIYCLPVFQGMVANSSDVLNWKGMAQQSFEFKEKYGYFPLWTNSLFSGMPTFQIMAESQYNITIAWLHYVFMFFLPQPAGLFFLACIGFYILSITLKLKSVPAIFGSLTYAFSTYNAILVATGHTTKFSSMGYAPAVLAGLILLTQRKYVLGFVTAFLFSTLMFYQNHVQVVYYTLLIAVCLGVSFFIQIVKSKDYIHLAKVAGLALIAGLIGFASYSVTLLSTYDYAKETMRGGKSELTIATNPNDTKDNKSKNGLDRDYAFQWSYGITETSTLIVPNARGGSSTQPLPEDSKTIEALQESGLPQQALNGFLQSSSPYWGDQPFTEGPVYFGALVCLLFIVGLFVVKSWHKGWLVAATLLGIMLSWGSHFAAFNNFLFDYLPFYNKFRAPAMALVISQLTVCALAAMALQSLMYEQWDKKELFKKLKFSGIATLVVIGLLALTYLNADFRGSADGQIQQYMGQVTQAMARSNPNNPQIEQQTAGIASSILTGLKADRKALFAADFGRSIIYILLGAVLIWLAASGKIKAHYAGIAICALSFIDLIGVDARYLNKDKYVSEEEFMAPFAANAADLQIKQDTSYYRVFDEISPSTARSSYHHNSIAGYHPAKLSLYDDLLTNQISKMNMNVINMLNTKYFIAQNPQTGQPMAQLNPGALGPAWFVKELKYVNSADEEMKALDSLNPAQTAVIDKREQPKVTVAPQPDSAATIKLDFNRNDQIKYSSKSSAPQFAVFSEVYYPRGWKAFIDGKEVPIARVNYTLRGLAVPAGSHQIEFKFDPESFRLGDKIGLVIGIISFLLLFGAAWYEWKQYRKNNSTTVKA